MARGPASDKGATVSGGVTLPVRAWEVIESIRDEADWLACCDPAVMLRFLRPPREDLAGDGPGGAVLSEERISDRKLRLFACGCCRQVWNLLTDEAECFRCGGKGLLHPRTYCPDCNDNGEGVTPGRINRSRRAVEVAERYVDGGATKEEMAEARDVVAPAYPPGNDATMLVRWSMTTSADLVARRVLVKWQDLKQSPATQADLLRCIVGNPWRSLTVKCPECFGRGEVNYIEPQPFVAHVKRVRPTKEDLTLPIKRKQCDHCHGNGYAPGINSQWLRWHSGTVPRMAQAIYDERSFGDCPILADALADAGCNHAGILSHLRGPGPHVRGCWVIDLILGKR